MFLQSQKSMSRKLKCSLTAIVLHPVKQICPVKPQIYNEWVSSCNLHDQPYSQFALTRPFSLDFISTFPETLKQFKTNRKRKWQVESTLIMEYPHLCTYILHVTFLNFYFIRKGKLKYKKTTEIHYILYLHNKRIHKGMCYHDSWRYHHHHHVMSHAC